jgi:hypothetical protein
MAAITPARQKNIMTTRNILMASGLMMAIFFAVAVVAFLQSLEPAGSVVQVENKSKPVRVPQAEVATVPMEKAPVEKTVAPSAAVQPKPTMKAQPRPVAGNGGQPGQAHGLGDPQARDALALVGADPDAEAYWIEAINDPDLSAKERRELIEDLNQDGFADTKNLSADDLPLIVNRLQLIEALWPDAMDDVNAAAFDEAYKDLSKMYARLTQN